MKQLLDKMVAARQLSVIDAKELASQQTSSGRAVVQTEDDVLRWLAKEYGLTYADLGDIEPDR